MNHYLNFRKILLIFVTLRDICRTNESYYSIFANETYQGLALFDHVAVFPDRNRNYLHDDYCI